MPYFNVASKIISWQHGYIIADKMTENEKLSVTNKSLLTGQTIQNIIETDEYEKTYSISGPALVRAPTIEEWIASGGAIPGANYGGRGSITSSLETWMIDEVMNSLANSSTTTATGLTYLNANSTQAADQKDPRTAVPGPSGTTFSTSSYSSPGTTGAAPTMNIVFDVPSIALLTLDAYTGPLLAFQAASHYGASGVSIIPYPGPVNVKTLPVLSYLLGPGWDTFAPMPTSIKLDVGTSGVSASIDWCGTSWLSPYAMYNWNDLNWPFYTMRQSAWYDAILQVEHTYPFSPLENTGLQTGYIESASMTYSFQYAKPKWIGRGEQPEKYILQSTNIKWTVNAIYDFWPFRTYLADRQDEAYRSTELVKFFKDSLKFQVSRTSGIRSAYFATMLEKVFSTTILPTSSVNYVGHSAGTVVDSVSVSHQRGLSRVAISGTTILR